MSGACTTFSLESDTVEPVEIGSVDMVLKMGVFKMSATLDWFPRCLFLSSRPLILL